MNIKPFTLSVVVGGSACNARCPFCISKMTVANGVELKAAPMNWKNWDATMDICRRAGVTTALITSKGEPTLFPVHMEQTLEKLAGNIPIIELQTNGLTIASGKVDDRELKYWFSRGLRVIAISNVGPDMEFSKEVYTPRGEYYDIAPVVEHLHSLGFSVRLATIMMRGGVDSEQKLLDCVHWARLMKAEQLTLRSVEQPLVNKGDVEAEKAAEWVSERRLWDGEIDGLYWYVFQNATARLLRLPHGAEIFDWNGQNVCFNNCLTESDDPDTIRQLIYFPDGHLRYSWQYEGAVLL